MIGPREQERFDRLVGASRTVVLATHMNPDGDAVGSEIGLADFLAARGRSVRIVNQDPTPIFLSFLASEAAGIELYDPAAHDAALAAADLVVLLDNSAPDRLGRMEPVMLAAADRVLCIDHHPTRGTPWAHNILDVESCATAAMIFELTRSSGFTPTPATAQALYVGLATDTGFFRFNSTSPKSHEIAAELLRLGVDPARCYQEIYERNPPALTRLLGHALAGMRLDAGGAVASVKITRAQVDASNAASVDTSEMTTALLATDGVRLALLLREMEGGRVKVSLRSKGDLDVHRLASEFGGGGHRNASGIVVSGAIDAVEETVLEKARALVSGAL